MTEHNHWMYGYLRLKKENNTLRQLIEECQQEHENERITLCEEIDGLRMLLIQTI